MNDTKTERAALAFNNLDTGGTSDKVYMINLDKSGDGYTVVAQYGRRGGPLAVDDKTKNGPVDYDAAKKIFDKVVREKLAKGYIRSGEAKASAPIAAPSSTHDSETGRKLSMGERYADIVSKPAAATFERPQELLEEIDEARAAALVADPNYWMQDKSDGHSRGVVKTGGAIFGLNKLGRRVPLAADLHAELEKIPMEAFQLDGELVGEKLVIRDLLHADGDIHALPYERRFNILVKALYGLQPALIDIVPTWEGAANKRAALDRQRAENREGVVFKLRSAPHRAGRNGQHKKFKFVKTLSAIAGKPRAKGKDSVEIYLLDGGAQKRVGTVSLIGKEQVSEGDILEVAYLYAFPSKMLSQARLLRKRDDVAAGECTVGQLIFKREETR